MAVLGREKVGAVGRGKRNPVAAWAVRVGAEAPATAEAGAVVMVLARQIGKEQSQRLSQSFVRRGRT